MAIIKVLLLLVGVTGVINAAVYPGPYTHGPAHAYPSLLGYPLEEKAVPVAYAPAPKIAYAPVAKYAPADNYDPNPHYSFAYDIQDGYTGDSKSQHETRTGDVVKGSYSLVDPDGVKRTVEYTADPHNGFNAVVHREPLFKTAAPVIAKIPAGYAAGPVTFGPAVPKAYGPAFPEYH